MIVTAVDCGTLCRFYKKTECQYKRCYDVGRYVLRGPLRN